MLFNFPHSRLLFQFEYLPPSNYPISNYIVQQFFFALMKIVYLHPYHTLYLERQKKFNYVHTKASLKDSLFAESSTSTESLAAEKIFMNF